MNDSGFGHILELTRLKAGTRALSLKGIIGLETLVVVKVRSVVLHTHTHTPPPPPPPTTTTTTTK
jgi:hypothetical protein